MTDGQRSRVWVWLLAGGAAFFIFVLAVFTLVYFAVRNDDKTEFAGGFGDKIAVIDVQGVIYESRPIIQQLRRYGDDDSIKAIILHINTPGGGAAASQEIYEAVKRVRDVKHKRVVASIETVGASGGYYVAMGANKIYANSASIVGSIGVIAQWYNYGDLMRWAKIHDITLQAGELKSAGTPTRDLTPKEREYLQSIIDDMHGQFIQAVADGRKMKVEEIRALASGRVWTGQQALPLKLIDSIGDFQTAVDDTAKSVGIKGEPTLVRPEKDRRSILDLVFGDVSDYLPDRTRMLQTGPDFFYLWK